MRRNGSVSRKGIGQESNLDMFKQLTYGLAGLCNTAQSERQVATLDDAKIAGDHSEKGKLQHLIPGLTTSIEKETKFPEDAYQAQACIGWLYWVEGPEHIASCLSALPPGLPAVLDPTTEKSASLTSWTYVCMIRSACLRGSYPYLQLSITAKWLMAHRSCTGCPGLQV